MVDARNPELHEMWKTTRMEALPERALKSSERINRLYESGKAKLIHRKRQQERVQLVTQSDKENAQECTFKPIINNYQSKQPLRERKPEFSFTNPPKLSRKDKRKANLSSFINPYKAPET